MELLDLYVEGLALEANGSRCRWWVDGRERDTRTSTAETPISDFIGC
jgi:hypothetical protein